jgi:hypothetical protein
MPAPLSAPAQTCPSCRATASGRFCSSCGASLDGATCSGCAAPLTPGAKFCHRCGTPAGASGAAAQERGFGSALPWAVAAIALVALIALVAGQQFARRADANARNAAPFAASPDASGMAGGSGPRAGAPGAAPDISSMSPNERAVRLYNRVMALSERGRADSVQLFAPMAIAAYEMMGPLNADQRYDLGRIHLIAREAPLAAAQADTILRQHPTHLLGLLLAADAARAQNEDAKARDYLTRFNRAQESERAKQLPEYLDHANDISSALSRTNAR